MSANRLIVELITDTDKSIAVPLFLAKETIEKTKPTKGTIIKNAEPK